MIGEGQGLGRGFYFTMRGFSGGRIQTAARAIGLMKGALTKRFGIPMTARYLIDRLPTTNCRKSKSRKWPWPSHLGGSYLCRGPDDGRGQRAGEASLVKLVTCKQAEAVTREAMQLHGGMGYAEETDVSRYWLDARVLSIFEGTEETLALKVVGRSLVDQAA